MKNKKAVKAQVQSVVSLLEVRRLNAKEAEEWASMEADEAVWSSAVQDVAALTRVIEILKRKQANIKGEAAGAHLTTSGDE